MFMKAYKQKSNNTLKNSEKKHLGQRILYEFPGITEEKVKLLVPVKSNTSCMKLVVHSGETVSLYVVDGAPMLLEADNRLVPTVCALWKVPDMVPTITIHTPVLPKVQGGAPLYLPGVAVPMEGVGFPMFSQNNIVGVCTEDNAAAAAVGRAAMSSGDMLLKASGVCLDMLQVFGDSLFKDPKLGKLDRPRLGPASYNTTDPAHHLSDHLQQLSMNTDEWPSLGKPVAAPSQETTPAPPETPSPPDPAPPADSPLQDHILPEGEAEEAEEAVPRDMDRLLQWSLLTFLKLDGKKVELPLKTNLLYKNHLMALCAAADRTLDVKRSSYKKISKFLEAMEKEGLVTVREVERGVWALTAFDVAHALVRRHAPPVVRAPAATAGYAPPTVRDVYCVTAAVAALLTPHKKGAALSAGEVRAALQQYVRERGLPSERGAVVLDAALAATLRRQPQERVRWEELTSGVLSRMTAGTELAYADGARALSRTRLEPVRMQLATRSGNKKVTLVSNLEPFGLNLTELAHVCQVGVAASCGVTRSPGAKADQLMLQGDQTHFVAKLLIEKYGFPKKFVEGADKALNKKK